MQQNYCPLCSAMTELKTIVDPNGKPQQACAKCFPFLEKLYAEPLPITIRDF